MNGVARRWMLPLVAVGCAGLTISQSTAVAESAQAALSPEEREALIVERQVIMMQLDRDSEILGEIVAGIRPRSELAATTSAIAQSAEAALAAFSSSAPGGRSKPEVWSDGTDFMQRMERFATETDELARLGEADNLHAVTDKLITALPCKECHDLYRTP